MKTPPNFDRLAGIYRMLEYLSMGRALERTRFHFLPRFDKAGRAIVLGDGDGRFISRLLAQNGLLHVDAVDTSAAMLEQLRARCAAFCSQLQTIHADARIFVQKAEPGFDVVATHFFLDCFCQEDVDAMARSIAAKMAPGGLWVLSEFRVPPGPAGIFSYLLVRLLYSAFGVLTGLRTRRLPDHEAALLPCGMVRIEQRLWWRGMLTAELWQKLP